MKGDRLTRRLAGDRLEKILRWYYEIHGFQYVTLRYFNATGAAGRVGEHHRAESHLIPRILQVALGQAEKADVFGNDYATPDGTCVRDYIHVLDLAQAHILALRAPESGAFNLGTGDGTSVQEVIDACRRITGPPIPVTVQPRRPGDPPRLVAASQKARRVLGWNPRFNDIATIVETAWHWHESHPEGYLD